MWVVFIIIFVLIIAMIVLYYRTRSQGDIRQKADEKIQEGQEEKKERILDFLEEKNEIRNNDVEELLGVSDVTATRYLDELENEGKIEQIGKEGRSVYYKLTAQTKE